MQCTEVRFASFLSGEFTTMAGINPSERKLAKLISVQWRNQGNVLKVRKFLKQIVHIFQKNKRFF